MINKLDSTTIHKISSGQLILDIPSTIKELIENSLDASSTQIIITLEDDGLTSINCRDNGVGIPPNDRPFIGQRHATSKISNLNDIEGVRTYGFRGEALASLCTIGQVTVTTRVQGEDIARTYDLDHHGNITTEKLCAGQRGTAVIVRNLFREFPVRLAIARKQRVSLARLKSLILTYAFVRDVRFVLQLRGNKRVDWTVLATSDPLAVAAFVYGKNVLQKYKKLSWSGGGITIDGIIPIVNQDTTVSDRQLQSHYLYVDNRPISLSRNPGKHLFKVLRETYPHASLTNSFVYLNFHCDAQKVNYDCNLDPAKSEILFERFNFICDCFTKFLMTLDNRTVLRSPSPSIEFFPRTQDQNRLLSPPPSSPIRNVYAVNEKESHQSSAVHPREDKDDFRPRMTTQPRKDVLRQTRLEEYRCNHVAAEQPPERTVNRASNLVIPTEMRSAMEYSTSIGEIDMTEGIVSSRRPRESEISELSDITPAIHNIQNSTANIARYGLPDVIDDEPVQASTKRRGTKAPNSSTKPNFKSLSPHNSRSHKSQSLSSPPTLPPEPMILIKQRSLEDSPVRITPNTTDTSLNPWTIAAMNVPSKRQRILPSTHRQPTNRPTPREENNCEDMSEQQVGLDLRLQTRTLVCHISIEEIAFGQAMQLNIAPPPCDLSDYLIQYCSSSEIYE